MLYFYESYNVLFRKKDGNSIVLPHLAASFVSGTIRLSDEYSDYQWVSLDAVEAFEPKIQNIPELTAWAKQKLENTSTDQLVQI